MLNRFINPRKFGFQRHHFDALKFLWLPHQGLVETFGNAITLDRDSAITGMRDGKMVNAANNDQLSVDNGIFGSYNVEPGFRSDVSQFPIQTEITLSAGDPGLLFGGNPQKITATAVNSSHTIRSAANHDVVAGETWTYTFAIKPDGTDKIFVQLFISGNQFQRRLDLTARTITILNTLNFTSLSETLTPTRNGYFEYVITGTWTNTNPNMSAITALLNSSNQLTYAGSGESIHIDYVYFTLSKFQLPLAFPTPEDANAFVVDDGNPSYIIPNPGVSGFVFAVFEINHDIADSRNLSYIFALTDGAGTSNNIYQIVLDKNGAKVGAFIKVGGVQKYFKLLDDTELNDNIKDNRVACLLSWGPSGTLFMAQSEDRIVISDTDATDSNNSTGINILRFGNSHINPPNQFLDGQMLVAGYGEYTGVLTPEDGTDILSAGFFNARGYSR